MVFLPTYMRIPTKWLSIPNATRLVSIVVPLTTLHVFSKIDFDSIMFLNWFHRLPQVSFQIKSYFQ
jgi:hypothetical protein